MRLGRAYHEIGMEQTVRIHGQSEADTRLVTDDKYQSISYRIDPDTRMRPS